MKGYGDGLTDWTYPEEDNVKQFISDIRKRDMEALIGMIKKQEKNQEIFWGKGKEIIVKLIKDYYEK